jgi:hypothetical protein
VAASFAAHLALLAALLTHRWDFQTPAETPDAPWERIIKVELAPHPHAAASAARPVAILSRTPRPGETSAPLPPVLSMPAPPVPAQAAPSAPAASAGGGAGTALADAAGLGAALRHGVLGCANTANLSREQRERCEDKLGAGAKHETVLAEGRDPRIQAYYDAVAKAKAPDKPLTPIRATGALGMFDSGNYGTTGHPPGIECHVSFGKGEKKRLPAHWLKLGPCALAPPQGPLSVEADLTPPDKDLSHPVEHAGPQRPPIVRPSTVAQADLQKAKDADSQTPPK